MWRHMQTKKKPNKTVYTVIVALVGLLCFCRGPMSVSGVLAAEGETDPHEPEVSRAEGAALQRARKMSEKGLAKAREFLDKKIDGESSAALPFALGVYCWRMDDLTEAAEAFRDALGRKKDFHRARMNLIRLRLEMENYGDAVGHITTLLQRDYREKGKLWKLLGYAHLMSGDYVAAEQAYRHATVYDGMKRDLGLGLARSLMNQNRMVAAGGVARGLLAEHPMSADLWMLLVNVDLSAGRDREALAKLEAMRRLGLTDDSALLTLGDLLLNQDCPVAALRTYREAARLEDVSISRLVDAATGLIGKGYIEEGRKLVSILKERGGIPEESAMDFRMARARLSEAEGKVDEALKLYEKIIENNPLHAKALLRAGDILRRQDRLEEALMRLERAARMDKTVRARALVRQAQVAVAREKYDRAIRLLKKSLSIRERDYVRKYLKSVERAKDVRTD